MQVELLDVLGPLGITIALCDMFSECDYSIDLASYLKNTSSVERQCGVLTEAYLRGDVLASYVRYIRRGRLSEVVCEMNLDERDVVELAETVRPHIVPVLCSLAFSSQDCSKNILRLK